jgi:hypothetical protein
MDDHACIALRATNGGAPGGQLANLPPLLERAREILIASGPRGDADAEALLAALEECVVAAHRLLLQRRMDGRAR